jgi:hypothetical protein
MQATCFGTLEPSSGLYLYFNTDPNFFLTIGIPRVLQCRGVIPIVKKFGSVLK